MNNFNQLCDQILQENYTITAREVLYRRYGKDVADRMISKIKARGNDEYLTQKYVLPDYSDENLNKLIPVIFKHIPGGNAGYGIPKGLPIKQRITIDPNPRSVGFQDAVKELNTGEITKHPIAYDLLGHETTHTLQKGLHLNPKNMFEYPLQYEFAPVLGEMKRWYYHETGILLDADATDNEINAFINYCVKRNIFNTSAYSNEIEFEKLLRTSEGKEVFRRIAKQTPIKSNTMTA
jgi:hypothetical protein